MGKRTVQEWRSQRMLALAEHADFGSLAALGRALGLESGAYVSQMIHGRRPITEKTVAHIEHMNNGRYAGWFHQPPAPDPYTEHFSLAAIELARAYDEVRGSHEEKRVLYAKLKDMIRATAHEQSPRAAPTAGLPADPGTRPGRRRAST